MRMQGVAICAEKARLLDDFVTAIQELSAVLSQKTQAVIENEPDISRFDALLVLAEDKKDAAKYAWIAHVEAHHCDEG